MTAYAAAFAASAPPLAVVGVDAQGRRDEGDELLLDDARVVAGLDREDALDDQRAGVELLLGELLQARGDREVDDVGRGDAEQRGDERGGDRRAERLGLVEVAEHVDQAEDGADDAHRRGVAAGLVERLHARGVALAHGVVLGLEDVGDEVGVGAVDDELQALAGERVLDRAR